MEFTIVKNVHGRYSIDSEGREYIQFNWEWPTVHYDNVGIAPINKYGYVEREGIIRYSVRDCNIDNQGNADYYIKKITSTKVRVISYCIFLFDKSGVPKNIQPDKECLCNVVVGSAKIYYKIRRPFFLKRRQGNLKPIFFTVRSNKSLEKDIAAYSFRYGGKEIIIPIQEIEANQTSKYSFLIPRYCSLILRSISPEYNDNIQFIKR